MKVKTVCVFVIGFGLRGDAHVEFSLWYAAVSVIKIICIIFDGKIEKVKSSL